MVTSPDEAAWLNPKWLVIGVALAAFGLILSYDLRLGLAAGALLGVIGAMWLYLALRYGSLSGATSGRKTLVAQVRRQASNRRRAAAGTQDESSAQQGADPAERP
jgi:hypothetical protein